MVDVVDQATRSRMMSGIQSKNTKPEILIRKALHARGFRYVLHPYGLPGRPDIVLPKWRVAIFVNGCFWHQHGCSISKMPSTNQTFWEEKFATNVDRDAIAQLSLISAGWRVATIWECTTRGKNTEAMLTTIGSAVEQWIRSDAQLVILELPIFSPSTDCISTQ